MDLFEAQRESYRVGAMPLALRMRPRTLEEFVGQRHFMGDGKTLRRTLEAERLSSALFHGPPGTGKTTLGSVIAGVTHAHFEQVNATSVGVREIRPLLAAARDRLETSGRRTILFVDELHRFNRAQQDVLLGDVENGVIILIGATTENPFFSVNTPLISRSQVFRFEPLSAAEIKVLLARAVSDSDRGLGALGVSLEDKAADYLAKIADGDARRALSVLEIAALSLANRKDGAEGGVLIDLAAVEDCGQGKALRYDAAGDSHYDLISAMIKSIRGGEPDAAVYWLARMLEGGEDPLFVARRIVIAAAEDVGNADPRGLIVAQAAADAAGLVGMPECRLPLAQAAIYLACAPKSNAVAQAIWQASDDVRNEPSTPVPGHLRSTGYSRSAGPGFGEGDLYPNDAKASIVGRKYYGVERVYYTPTDQGAEAVLRDRLSTVRLPDGGGENQLR